jgi:allophanate hydrolase subunit 1
MAGRRNHEFTGVPIGPAPSLEEAVALVDKLDGINEEQRLRLMAVMDWLEDAVTQQVREECRADDVTAQLATERSAHHSCRQRVDQLEAELAALNNTKLIRYAAPFRSAYARLRARRG